MLNCFVWFIYFFLNVSFFFFALHFQNKYYTIQSKVIYWKKPWFAELNFRKSLMCQWMCHRYITISVCNIFIQAACDQQWWAAPVLLSAVRLSPPCSSQRLCSLSQQITHWHTDPKPAAHCWNIQSFSEEGCHWLSVCHRTNMLLHSHSGYRLQWRTQQLV